MGSALPVVVGAKPLSDGDLYLTPDGIVRFSNGAAQLRLFEHNGRRILRGQSERRLVAVEGRYVRGEDGRWTETESTVLEYGCLPALEGRSLPERRLSTITRPDGSVLTTTFERVKCKANDEEMMTISTCLVNTDRSRLEQEESILRVQDRARYDVYRRSFDERRKAKKALEYRYPWLPHTYYEQVWNKLVEVAMSSAPFETPVRAAA